MPYGPSSRASIIPSGEIGVNEKKREVRWVGFVPECLK